MIAPPKPDLVTVNIDGKDIAVPANNVALTMAPSAHVRVVVDFTGFDPGSCAMVFVRDSTSPSRTFVFVCDLLHSPPPSLARATQYLSKR